MCSSLGFCFRWCSSCIRIAFFVSIVFVVFDYFMRTARSFALYHTTRRHLQEHMQKGNSHKRGVQPTSNSFETLETVFTQIV